MKKYKYLSFVAILVLLTACTEETYTFKGKVLNGTTMEPIPNLIGNFRNEMGQYPFNKSMTLAEGIRTDKNGAFEFSYELGELKGGLIYGYFEDPNRPFFNVVSINNIRADQDNFVTMYDSDSATTLFVFRADTVLNDGEFLKLRVGSNPEFNFTLDPAQLATLESKVQVRTEIGYYTYYWDRISASNPKTDFNVYETKGDPYIDTIIINY
jgi:hypothetical protein